MKNAIKLLTAFSLLLMSCAGMEKLVQPPSAKVDAVNIQKITFEDITLGFDLLVENPNNFGVRLSGFDYELALQNQNFLQGEQNEEIAIASAGGSTVTIPLTINFQKLYNLVQQTKTLDSLTYGISGSFRPAGLLSGFNIPFDHTGKIPNVRIPKISLKNLKVDKLDFSGVLMKLTLGVQNPNVFGLQVDDLNYAISLSGKQVADGSTQNLANIQPKESGDIQIPISLNFFGVASSLSTALSGEKINAALEGNAGIETPFGSLNVPLNMSEDVRIFK